MAFTLDLQR